MGGKTLFVGITGGIGAGKSAFGRALARLGYPVLSADEIAREITAPGSDALPEIQAVFGPGTLRADGTLDRPHLRARIAADSALRQKLEAITHPRIQTRCQTLAAEKFAAGAGIVFYEAPLLFEAKSDRHLDAVVCVAASDEIRLERVEKRDGSSRAQAEALLKAQMPQDEKIQRSDLVVWNDGTEGQLAGEAQRVADFLEQWRQQAPRSQ